MSRMTVFLAAEAGRASGLACLLQPVVTLSLRRDSTLSHLFPLSLSFPGHKRKELRNACGAGECQPSPVTVLLGSSPGAGAPSFPPTRSSPSRCLCPLPRPSRTPLPPPAAGLQILRGHLGGLRGIQADRSKRPRNVGSLIGSTYIRAVWPRITWGTC